MESLAPPVQTCCLGKAYSAAAAILASGSRGGRTASSNAQIIFNEPYTTQIEHSPAGLAALDRLKTEFFNKIVEHTRMPPAQVKELHASERALTALEAIELGIVDFIWTAPRV